MNLWCSLLMLLPEWVSALGEAGGLGCTLDSRCLGFKLEELVAGPSH